MEGLASDVLVLISEHAGLTCRLRSVSRCFQVAYDEARRLKTHFVSSEEHLRACASSAEPGVHVCVANGVRLTRDLTVSACICLRGDGGPSTLSLSKGSRLFWIAGAGSVRDLTIVRDDAVHEDFVTSAIVVSGNTRLQVLRSTISYARTSKGYGSGISLAFGSVVRMEESSIQHTPGPCVHLRSSLLEARGCWFMFPKWGSAIQTERGAVTLARCMFLCSQPFRVRGGTTIVAKS